MYMKMLDIHISKKYIPYLISKLYRNKQILNDRDKKLEELIFSRNTKKI